MKTKIKKLWVAALRSGEYKQARGQLRYRNRFCCLGVLCNLHAQAHPEIAAKQIDPQKYMGHDAFLPNAVRVWAGLPNDNGAYVRVNYHNHSLSGLNDSGTSFAKIAELIEAQL